MTSPRARRISDTGPWLAAVGGALTLVAPIVAHAASAQDLYYERTVMSVADARCRLFSAPLGQALAAAQAQARGAALRANTDPATLSAVQGRAEAKASSVACDNPDLQTAAGRIRSAFEAFGRMTRMRYPGDTAAWAADRTPTASAVWRLSQPASFGADRMTFGLAGRDAPGALVAVASFADGASPYAARLVLRDPRRAPVAYLDHSEADSAGRLPPTARMAPRALAQTYLAQSRDGANPVLLPAGTKAGWTFRFSAQAVEALSALDPREAVCVEFIFAGRDGDQIRTAYVEVGDFAAGRAFVRYAAR
jgi:hypothetical protein